MNLRSKLAILLLAGILGGCAADKTAITTKTDQLRTQPTSAKAERRNIVGYLLIDGDLYVPPTATALIRAPYTAPVQEVLKTVGQHVEKGEPVVKMSLPDQQAYLAQAQANLKAAEAAEASAKLSLGGPQRDAEKQLADARSTERTLRTQAAQGGDDSQLQQAVVARQAAEENLLLAKADVKDKMLPYDQQLEAARTTYQQAKSGARQANVTAPISGTLISLVAQPGQQLTGTTEIARVVDLSKLQVKADLTPQQAGVVNDEKSVVITFVGLEDKPINGEVTDIRTLPADANNVKRTATIDFKNDAGVVKPGMKVKSVGVKMGQVNDALSVPLLAVFHDSTGKPCVHLMKDGQWINQVVETGLSDGFAVQIKSGLNEGDTVQVPGSP